MVNSVLDPVSGQHDSAERRRLNVSRVYLYAMGVTLILILYIWFIYRTLHSNRPQKLREAVKRILVCGYAPVAGNLIAVFSHDQMVIRFGYVIYLVGTTWLLYYILQFAMVFCEFRMKGTLRGRNLLIVTILDTIMICLNPILHHAFKLEGSFVEGIAGHGYIFHHLWYYRIHMLFNTFMTLVLLWILIHKMTQVSAIYLEKYAVILAVLSFTVIWQFVIAIGARPLDGSMLGFEISGALIYIFAIEYRPFLLRDRMFAAVVTKVSDALFFFNYEEECIYYNTAAKEMFDLEGEEDFQKAHDAVQKLIPNGADFVADSLSRKVRIKDDAAEEEKKIGTSFLSTIQTRKVFNDDKVYETEFRRIYDSRNIYAGFFVTAVDRTEEEMQMFEENYKATHDALTGALNKEELYRQTEILLKDNPETEYVVVASDIKEFKLINDIFGDAVGDEVLTRVAKTVMMYLKPTDRFGRIGSDRYGMIMRKADFSEEVFTEGIARVAHVANDIKYPIIIHIGVYEVTNRKMNAQSMYDRAFLAIESIKNDVQRRIARYDDSLRKDRLWDQMIIGSLDDALANGDIEPYIQAQVSADGTVKGGEALVRWNHATEGFLNPGRFMESLEKNGLVVKVDTFIWEYACRTLRRWEDEGYKDRYLSVNISPRDFYFLDIYEKVTGLVEKYGLRPDQLRLEITESSMMNDPDQKIEIINRLRSAGFILEMDDFGSGYSSLNMLKDMPIDVLKIDMIFLRSVEQKASTRIILQHIIQMAKQMQIEVVTEGVEGKDQVEFLTDFGCDMFQGYYFSKPVSIEEFEEKYIRN